MAAQHEPTRKSRRPLGVHGLAGADEWLVPPAIRRMPERVMGPALKWAYVSLWNLAGGREGYVDVAPRDLGWLLGVDRTTAIKWLRRGKGRRGQTDLESAGLVEVLTNDDGKPFRNDRGEWRIYVFGQTAALALVKDNEPARPLFDALDDDALDDEEPVASAAPEATEVVAFARAEATAAQQHEHARGDVAAGPSMDRGPGGAASQHATVQGIVSPKEGASRGVATRSEATSPGPRAGPGPPPSSEAVASAAAEATDPPDAPRADARAHARAFQEQENQETLYSNPRSLQDPKGNHLGASALTSADRDGPDTPSRAGEHVLAISAASNNVRWDRAVVNARRLHEAVRRAERTLGITAIDRDRYCDKSVFRKWRDLLYAGVLTRQHVDELCYEVLKHAQSNTFTKWPGAYVNARSAQITRAAGGHWTKPKE